MADQYFCGSHLRLSAFLQMEESRRSIKKPQRFRRKGGSHEHDKKNPPPTECNNVQAKRTGLDQDEFMARVSPDFVLDIGSGTDVAVCKEPGTHQSSDSVPIKAEPSHERKYKKKTTVTAKSTRTTPGASHCQPPSTWKRHLLPVNGLALVRTTTDIGLPSPSDLDSCFPTTITDSDPIEDSPSQFPTQRKKGDRRKITNPQSETPLGSFRKCMTWSKPQHRGPHDQTIGRKAKGNTHPMGKEPFSKAVSDGFVGIESMLPPPKTRKRARKCVQLATAKETSIFTHGELELGSGPLPELSLSQHRFADLSQVRKQLSSVTAPARADSHSESEAEQEDEEVEHEEDHESQNDLEDEDVCEHEEYFSDEMEADSQDEYGFFQEEGSDAAVLNALGGLGEGAYFAEAMFHAPEEESGYFWSQYGNHI